MRVSINNNWLMAVGLPDVAMCHCCSEPVVLDLTVVVLRHDIN
jgi:hypothetical protein